MRLRVIATDYDGTIAQDGVLHPSVRAAIATARQRGVLVIGRRKPATKGRFKTGH